MFVSSCKKENKSQPESPAKKYNVRFDVSGFAQEISGSGTAKKVNDTGTPLSGQIDVLTYNVLGLNKNKVYYDLVSVITQNSTDPQFGVINDNLPAGKYQVIVFGGKTGLKAVHYSTYSAKYYSVGPYKFFYPGDNPDAPPSALYWNDTFYKSLEITVSDTSANHAINLERIVGKLEITFTDVMPANAKTITYSYGAEYPIFDFQNGKPQQIYGAILYPNSSDFRAGMVDMVKTVSVPDSAKGQTGFNLSNFIMNTGGYLTVNINCYDADSKLISTRKIENVPVEKNKITKLTGKLFDVNANFGIDVNDNWDETPVIINY